MIDLTGRARCALGRGERGSHVMVGEHVAGAHDHCSEARQDIGSICNYLYLQRTKRAKKKSRFYSYSNPLGRGIASGQNRRAVSKEFAN
jgi:hypothetical protein